MSGTQGLLCTLALASGLLGSQGQAWSQLPGFDKDGLLHFSRPQTQAAPDYVPPAASRQSEPEQDEYTEETDSERTESADDGQSVTTKPWFWGAVAGVLITAAVILLVTSQPSSAPSTTLGNMEAFNGQH